MRKTSSVKCQVAPVERVHFKLGPKVTVSGTKLVLDSFLLQKPS
jgi:hypothetical protein